MLNSVHMIVCWLIWPSLITHKVMYNNFSLVWVEFEEKSFKSYWINWVCLFCVKILKIWEKCFWKLLEVLICITYHKNWFSAVFYKISKFLKSQKIFIGSIDQSWSLTDWKCSIFRPEVSISLDSYSITFQSVANS